ncbi:MAG: DUF177 domain-containing protein [Flavobacteriales bacterium]|nr:DUF177 domain-containing protein [Flavobacteriales bacterium]
MKQRDFVLQFGSIKEGKHQFEYHLTDSFFKFIDGSLITNANVVVLLEFERFVNHLQLKFDLKGWVEKECDVCLSTIQYPIKSSQTLLVKMSSSPEEDEAEIVWLPLDAHEIDLTTHLYDFVVLSIPIKVVCKDSLNRKECDKEIIKKMSFKEDSAGNENHPEWQKLKDIFKN